MPRICIEIVGRDCRECFEVEDCTDLAELASRLAKSCSIPIDLETTAFIVNDEPVKSSTICRDANVKVVRLLRGG